MHYSIHAIAVVALMQYAIAADSTAASSTELGSYPFYVPAEVPKMQPLLASVVGVHSQTTTFTMACASTAADADATPSASSDDSSEDGTAVGCFFDKAAQVTIGPTFVESRGVPDDSPDNPGSYELRCDFSSTSVLACTNKFVPVKTGTVPAYASIMSPIASADSRQLEYSITAGAEKLNGQVPAATATGSNSQETSSASMGSEVSQTTAAPSSAAISGRSVPIGSVAEFVSLLLAGSFAVGAFVL